MSTTPPDPYTPPAAPIAPTPADLDHAELRRPGLRREAALRSLGLLIAMVASWLLVFCLGSVPRTFELMTGRSRMHDEAMTARVIQRGIGFAAVGLSLGPSLIALGFGLRRLRAWARWGTFALTVLLLGAVLIAFFKFATLSTRWLLSADYFLYLYIPCLLAASGLSLLTAPPAGLVFSEAYRAAVRATPDLQPKTGWGARIVLGLMVLIALLMLLTGVTHTAPISGR